MTMPHPPCQDYTNVRAKAVTLFSGLGSSSQALRSLGYHVIPHDFMSEAVASLHANGFRDARQIDVRKIDYGVPEYANIEILVGGPPCQPFSQATSNDGRYDDRDMIPEFLRAIAELLPELFVMEEVQTLTWAKHKDYLARVEDDMRALGYRVEHRVLNAADYGIPQARKRLFVLGVREDVAQERETSRVVGTTRSGHTYYSIPRDPVAWPNREDYEPVTMARALGWDERECRWRNVAVPDRRAHDHTKALWPMERASTTVVGTFRPEVQAAPGYRKAGNPPRQATPGSVVTTLEERLILQGLPTDWVVCGSQAKRDLQVGNSVPMPLIRDLIDLNIH